MKVVTRGEALAAGLKRYYTGEPCKKGHISERQVANFTCCECASKKKRASYHSDVDVSRAKRRADYKKNKSRILRANSESRARNAESVIKSKRAYYLKVSQDPEWRAKQAILRAVKRELKRAYDAEYSIKNSVRKTAQALAWAKANPDRRAATVAAYDGRRRDWKSTKEESAEIRKWIRSASKICHWCGVECAADFHADHYYPLSKGGRHVVSNMVISCPTCNLKKGAKDPVVFAAQVSRTICKPEMFE